MRAVECVPFRYRGVLHWHKQFNPNNWQDDSRFFFNAKQQHAFKFLRPPPVSKLPTMLEFWMESLFNLTPIVFFGLRVRVFCRLILPSKSVVVSFKMSSLQSDAARGAAGGLVGRFLAVSMTMPLPYPDLKVCIEPTLSVVYLFIELSSTVCLFTSFNAAISFNFDSLQSLTSNSLTLKGWIRTLPDLISFRNLKGGGFSLSLLPMIRPIYRNTRRREGEG